MRFSRVLRRRRALAPTVLVATLYTTLVGSPLPASATPGVRSTVVPVTLTPGHVTPLELPWRANLVAIEFIGQAAPAPISVAVDGVWYRLAVEADHAPDRREAVRAKAGTFTDPIWIGTSRTLALRLAGVQSRRIRVHAINSRGDSSVAPAPLRILGAVWRSLTMPRAGEAAAPSPSIISRASWGANESWSSDRPGSAGQLKAIVVHHTDSANRHAKSDVPAIIRGIYRYHTATRGWSDIGYNFLIDRWGRVFEGRAGGIANNVIGAHARDHNVGSAGIAMIGTFSDSLPPRAARQALTRLVAWKADIGHIPINGSVVLGDGGHAHQRVMGHRNANPTACPGSKLYAYLKWLRIGADRIGHPKIELPLATTSILRPDGDGRDEVWELTARFTREVDWRVQIRNAGGAVVAAMTGHGTRLLTAKGDGVTWNGRIAGVVAPTGIYTWTVTAQQGASLVATPATGRLFLVADHPDGTLLRDASGMYRVQDGTAEPVSRLAALTTFPTRHAVWTGPAERARYARGTSAPIRDGALLRAADGIVYLYDAPWFRPFDDPATFEAYGYSDDAIIPMVVADGPPTVYPTPITLGPTHPSGTVVRETLLAGGWRYWYLEDGLRRELSSLAVASRVRTVEIVDALPEDLLLPAASWMPALDGALTSSSGARWLLDGGQRRRFSSLESFSAYGFRDAMLLFATASEVNAYPTGTPIG